MSSQLRASRRLSMISAALLPFCVALSACGGGGGDVANIPPPPPPPPPPLTGASVDVQTAWLDSPATRTGTYDLIGRLTLTPGNGDPATTTGITPGQFTMNVSRDPYGDPANYQLKVPAGVLPAGLGSITVAGEGDAWTINLDPPSWTRDDSPYNGDYVQYFGQRFTAFSKPADGSAETELFSFDLTRDTSIGFQGFGPNAPGGLGDKQLKATLDYDTGYSYVAMGEWGWQVLGATGNPAGDSGSLLFVNGDRTPGSGIPVSGTAIYQARTLGAGAAGELAFTLGADFGQRSITTEIDSSAFDVAGTAPFTNDGSFEIPLSGTANSHAADGSLEGAFFGPHAEQVGGVFSIQSQGATVEQDAFVGQRPH